MEPLEDEEPGSPREAISARLATAWPDLLLCPSPTETGARAAVFAALHGLLTAVRDPAALPADLPAVTAIRIASDAGTTLVSGAVEQVTVEAAIPAESAPGSSAPTWRAKRRSAPA